MLFNTIQIINLISNLKQNMNRNKLQNDLQFVSIKISVYTKNF